MIERRHSIAEVSEMTDVPKHVLRQWEDRIPHLKPKRDRAGRRFYLKDDIHVVRRIKELHWDEGLNTEGVIKRLNQELHGHGRLQTTQEIVDLLDSIEEDIRSMLDLLDQDPAD